MNSTLLNFKWDDKQDRKWLTNYFSNTTRQPKSGISVPIIKGTRNREAQEKFELFFEKLLDGNDNDKKIRKNIMSAWRKKIKLENHKQISIELTSEEYEQLIYLKDLRGEKSTIKETILDLIFNTYEEKHDIRQSLENEIRKELAQEKRKKIQIESSRKKNHDLSIASVTENNADESISNFQQSQMNNQRTDKSNLEQKLIEKIDALTSNTNEQLFQLKSILTDIIKTKKSPITKEPSLKIDLVTKTLASIHAINIKDAIKKAHKRIKLMNLDLKSQTILFTWDNNENIRLSEEDALTAKTWHNEWINKSEERRNQCDIITELTHIKVPQAIHSLIIEHATNVYNELLRYNLQADINLSDVIAEWDHIEELVKMKKGNEWLKPLTKMNHEFRRLMIAYLDNITISQKEESNWGSVCTDNNITIVENRMLILVPWSLSSTKLTLDDLHKGISINSSKHASLEGLYVLVQDIVKRAGSSNISDCQILTADGTVINVGVSMFEKSGYILYIK